jgi:hypothetical protein
MKWSWFMLFLFGATAALLLLGTDNPLLIIAALLTGASIKTHLSRILSKRPFSIVTTSSGFTELRSTSACVMTISQPKKDGSRLAVLRPAHSLKDHASLFLPGFHPSDGLLQQETDPKPYFEYHRDSFTAPTPASDQNNHINPPGGMLWYPRVVSPNASETPTADEHANEQSKRVPPKNP